MSNYHTLSTYVLFLLLILKQLSCYYIIIIIISCLYICSDKNVPSTPLDEKMEDLVFMSTSVEHTR